MNIMKGKGGLITRFTPNGSTAVLWILSLGGLFVFQSSQEVSVPKIVYVGIYAATAVFGALALTLEKKTESTLLLAMPFNISLVALFYTLLLLMYFGSNSNQVRDFIPYFLIALAPAIGRYIGRRFSQKYLIYSTVLVSVIASILTFADWISRRGATDILSKVGLSSAILPAFGLSLAFWMALYTKGVIRLYFTVSTALIIGLMLGTGNRTNFVLLLVFIPLVIFRASQNKFANKTDVAPKRNNIFIIFSSLAGLLGLIGIYISYLGLGTFVQERLVTLTQIFLNNATNDQSFLLRAMFYQISFEAFMENPIFGLGFAPFQYIYAVDSPFLGLAKIGIVGNILFSCIIVGLLRVSRRFASSDLPLKHGYLAWLIVILALLPFGTIWEDKGLALALILGFAIAHSSLLNGGSVAPRQEQSQESSRRGALKTESHKI